MTDAFQPNPAHGVFATMLVVDGVPLELDAQVARLRASVRVLYAAELPGSAAASASEAAGGTALGRLRLSATPRESGAPHVEAVAVPIEPQLVLPGWDGALDLAPMAADGWHGAHKWVDRRLLERLDARAAPASAVLVDRVRGVLETTRGNVFVVGPDGIVRTPPTDGAILPGVTRARVIALAREAGLEVREERVAPETLHAAQEAFATGSVRGVEPIRSFDGAPLDGPGEITAALTDALRRHWLWLGAGQGRRHEDAVRR